MTDWNTWSRIVDAAQDPRHRDAVQQYLAQADLSAELPAEINERLLAPRRSAGATGEQCAFLLCNLGFAALVAGTRDAADFATGCGRQARELAPVTPDLALRCHFLFSKSASMIAVLSGQPHVMWDDAVEKCTGYLSAVDQLQETLPAEAVESNAMAAFSFAAQLLTRIDRNRAVGYFAHLVSQLVDTALTLAKRLSPGFVSRMWAGVIPGTAADLFFLRIGAIAEHALQLEDESSDHARKGISYADEFLSRSRTDTERAQVMRTRGELLLFSGRFEQAMEQAEALEQLSDRTSHAQAGVVRARHELMQGDAKAAAELLARVAPGAGEALEHWRQTWQGDTGEKHWTTRSGESSAAEIDQEIWRLQAVVAVEQDDKPGFLAAAGLANGFLADSLFQDGEAWAGRTVRRADVEPVEPVAALDDVLSRLDDGTALIQLVNTGAGILTWVARKRDGAVSQEFAPGRPNPRELSKLHGAWSRACFDHWQSGAGAAASKAGCTGAFSTLMDEVRRHWGTLLEELVDDGTSQVVFIGDDLVDIPIHATRIGPGDERLIDRVPVAYVPSLPVLRACMALQPVGSDRRRGLELHSIAAPDSASVEALSEILETEPVRMTAVSDPSDWENAAAAEVFHVDARANHNAQLPLQSMLGAGWLDLSFASVLERLELPRCELVSGFACESVLPSMLRAPGFDLATVFLAAGARNVLASTWPANDDLAAAMTRLFFQRWATGLTPSIAFREALRAMRSERSSLEDFEWACMRLVGAP